MFTGIIESLGQINNITEEGGNKRFYIKSSFLPDLKIDQSIAHNGVCLTVIEILKDSYAVQAIAETLEKTNLSNWKKGDNVNLERAVSSVHRLDGHIVQGHVDEVSKCIEINSKDGSWDFWFNLSAESEALIIPQGSITINGTSLTVSDIKKKQFKVSIIPYTYENTVFKYLQVGDSVNLEYDMLGKYVVRYLKLYDTNKNGV